MKALSLALALACLAAAPVAAQEEEIVGPATVTGTDSLRIGNRFMFLFGIDPPERANPCFEANGRPWVCDRPAVRQLEILVDAPEIRCVAKAPPDPFRRVPVVCYSHGRDVNLEMVKAGYAMAVPEETTDYVAAEAEAKAKRVGMWRGTFIEPKVVREMRRRD